jgi:hypothetical protein
VSINELSLHPPGAAPKLPKLDCRALVPTDVSLALDTFNGRVHLERDPSAAVTPLGQVPFFNKFLKLSGLFDPWVDECLFRLRSNNAPNKCDVLGTMVLSVVCGHWLYAHISAPRGDQVNAEVLGMSKVVSEDVARGTPAKMEEPAAPAWLQKRLLAFTAPSLGDPWTLDPDVTVKPICGHQEGAVLGYTTPHKPVARTHALNERARRLAMHHDRPNSECEAWVWLTESHVLARWLTTSLYRLPLRGSGRARTRSAYTG